MVEDSAAVRRLRAAVELLAMPGDSALARAGVGRPDALAVEFDEAYTVFVSSLSALPDEAQLAALQRLDQQLQIMSDPDLRSKWTAEAMKTDGDWEDLRALARAALTAFSW